MPHALVADLDALDGPGLKQRFVAARTAATAAGAHAALQESDAALLAAMRSGIRAMATAIELAGEAAAAAAARPLPVPAAPSRTLANLPAAAAASAARNANRPSPMRRLPPVPPRPADDDTAPAAPVDGGAPAQADAWVRPADDAAAPAPVPAGNAGAVPARPAPAAPLRPRGVAGLRRAAPAEDEGPVEAPEPAEQAVRHPVPQVAPPRERPTVQFDANAMKLHRKKFGALSTPYVRPDGTVNYHAPAFDRMDDEIPF